MCDWSEITQVYFKGPCLFAAKLMLLIFFFFTLSQTMFLHVCGTSILKTLWKKEKLLLMSNFFFFHSIFQPFHELYPFSSNRKLSSAHSLSFEILKNSCLEKGIFSFYLEGNWLTASLRMEICGVNHCHKKSIENHFW